MDSDNCTNNNDNSDAADFSDPFEGSSSLDHALLESLFYNEMAQMEGDDDEISESSLFLGLGVGSEAVDLSVIAAEKEMLRGFGVMHNHSPVPVACSSSSSAADVLTGSNNTTVGLADVGHGLANLSRSGADGVSTADPTIAALVPADSSALLPAVVASPQPVGRGEILTERWPAGVHFLPCGSEQ